MWRHRKKLAIYQPGREHSPDSQTLIPQPPDHEKNKHHFFWVNYQPMVFSYGSRSQLIQKASRRLLRNFLCALLDKPQEVCFSLHTPKSTEGTPAASSAHPHTPPGKSALEHSWHTELNSVAGKWSQNPDWIMPEANATFELPVIGAKTISYCSNRLESGFCFLQIAATSGHCEDN